MNEKDTEAFLKIARSISQDAMRALRDRALTVDLDMSAIDERHLIGYRAGWFAFARSLQEVASEMLMEDAT